MCHFGMFDRHQAEITVMQFTGDSLPVHQSMTVPWDFKSVPYCQPDSAHANGICTSAVFRRSIYYILSSGTKLFITFELKALRHKESDTQSFYADFSICPHHHHHHARHPAANYWSDLGEPRKSTVFFGR